MIKRLQAVETYHFANYDVVLEGLKNDNNGNRRFKATIVDHTTAATSMSAVYTFTGHCSPEREEAEWILQLHLDESQN